MTTSDLPPDLVEEILSWVPAKTLSRLRSTCKPWNALFKDQRFTKKHLDRAPKQLLALMLNEHKVSSLRFNLHGINNNTAAPSIESKSDLNLKESHPSSGKVDILGVFHCDGLLLCATEKDRLVVWNPCTGETRCIKPSNLYYKYSMFALGYNNNRSYKLLRYRNNSDTDYPTVEFEIYEFSSDSWRCLEITANFLIKTSGVSLKGNTYWVAFDGYLLSFDFSTERLDRKCLPFKNTNCCCTSALSIDKDEKLAVLRQRFDTLKLEIWVTSIDKSDHQNTVLSWRKFLAVDRSKLNSSHFFSSRVRFFIDEDMKVVVCCDVGRGLGQDKTIKSMISVVGDHCGEIHFGELLCKTGQGVMFNYVPSLVRI